MDHSIRIRPESRSTGPIPVGRRAARTPVRRARPRSGHQHRCFTYHGNRQNRAFPVPKYVVDFEPCTTSRCRFPDFMISHSVASIFTAFWACGHQCVHHAGESPKVASVARKLGNPPSQHSSLLLMFPRVRNCGALSCCQGWRGQAPGYSGYLGGWANRAARRCLQHVRRVDPPVLLDYL